MRRLIRLILVGVLLLACRAGGDTAAHTDTDAPGEIGRMIDAATAGATVHVRPGIYRERLRITRSVSLVADGTVILDGGGTGDIVEILAPDVTLKGFVLRDTGIDLDRENAAIRIMAPRAVIEDNTLEDILFGIDLREAPECVIRNNRIGGKPLDIARRGDGIRLWRADRSLVERNFIHDGRDAILWYSTGVTVRGNTSQSCRYGFHLMYSDQVVLEGNRLIDNSVGIYAMYSRGVSIRDNLILRNRGPSGYGIGLKETGDYSVAHNTLVANRVGAYLDGSPFGAGPARIEQNTIARNDIGMTFLPSCRGNLIVSNNFVENIEQVSVGGRGAISSNAFSENQRGNFWSDYNGYDRDETGVGEFVYESRTLFENLMDREPKLRLLLFSPTQQAIEFVGRAVPATRPDPIFCDEYPLMRPAAQAGVSLATHSGDASLGLAGCGLLLVGAAVVCIAFPPLPVRLRERSGAAARSAIGAIP